MKKKQWILGAAALMVLPLNAIAAAPTSHLDVYYTKSELDAGVELDGNGFGLRGRAMVSDQLFVHGEYESVEYDENFGGIEVEVEVDRLRAGLGAFLARRGNADLYVKGELVHVDGEVRADGQSMGSGDDTGIGIHGGVALNANPNLLIFGELGYVDIDDASGPELTLGAAFSLTPQLAAMADYRMSELDDADSDDLQLGLRFRF